MQIWLGKQYLGQADQMVTDAQVNINIGHSVMETEYLRVNQVRARAKALPALPAAQEIEISCVEII